MADLSTIEAALAALVAGIVYPNGTGAASVTGRTVRIYRGWPEPQALNADLRDKTTCNVSIYSLPGGSRNVSRYDREWHSIPGGAATLTATAVRNTVTYGGTAATGELASLTVGGIGFIYAVEPGDTLGIIAAAIAGAINSDGQFRATIRGPTVTVTAYNGLAIPVTGFGSSTGTAWRETRRQEQRLMVTVWCPTPALRDTLAAAIDNGMSDVDWLDAGDPTSARIRYFSTAESDAGTNASEYRRDLNFAIEYPTIQTVIAAPLIVPAGLLHIAGTLRVFSTAQPGSGIAEDGSGALLMDAAGNLLSPILQPASAVSGNDAQILSDDEGNLVGTP